MKRPTDFVLADLSKSSYINHSFANADTKIEGLVINSQEHLLIAFRGTEPDISDIIRDIRIIPWHTALGWIHSGFYKGAMSVWDQLSGEINNAKLSKKPLYLTGHSLGGAMALIFGARLAREGRSPAGIITFGSPAVTYSGKMKSLLKDVEVIRYVNGADTVPSLPRLARHITDPTRIGPKRTWSRRFSQKRYTDHFIDSYLESMKA